MMQPEVTTTYNSKDPKGAVMEKEVPDFSKTAEVLKTNFNPHVFTFFPHLPIPRRFANVNKKMEQVKEILNVFKKVHVNIPMIVAIDKFLCTQFF